MRALLRLFVYVFLFLMARLDNIVPPSRYSFDPRRNLTRSDVVASAHALIVTFRSTKTYSSERVNFTSLCYASQALHYVQSPPITVWFA